MINTMAEVKPSIFTMLGPSGSGKTSMLACMYRTLENMMPGAFSPERNTFGILDDTYEQLEREANSPKRQFNVRVLEGTQEIRSFDFSIAGKKNIIPIRFYDFPGGYIERSANNKDYDDVVNIVRNSSAIIVAVDTPYIMEPEEERGKYIKQACTRDIEQVIKVALSKNTKQDRLILFVPIKCEKYVETWDGRQVLKSCVKSAFKDTIRMGEDGIYKGKLAIAIVPISTIGNVKFSSFNKKDGRVTEKVFMKPANKRFKPEYTDQPLRFVLSLLFEQVRKQQEISRGIFDIFLDWVCVWNWEFFSPDNMPEIINEYVRKGIRTSDDRFEIICGRKLMGLN